MNKQFILENYSANTQIIFKSIKCSIAKKLFLFAIEHTTGETIVINSIKYTLNYKSFHGAFNSCSIYFTARNRLYRISDHWSDIGGRGGAKLTSCGWFGKKPCHWTITGPEEYFDVQGVNHDYSWTDKYNFTQKYTWDSGRLECGYVELRKIRRI